MNKSRFSLRALSMGFIVSTTLLAGDELSATESKSPVPTVQGTITNIVGWSTNAPAVFAILQLSSPTNTLTNNVFDHYLPESLNNLVWTNFIAHTNGRNIAIWSLRSHPTGWPTNAPIVAWNTNCLMWGMRGLTALSPCWEDEGSSGQVPVTALTRRHGYTRGHGMGVDGFTTNRNGKSVWFVTTNNTVVQTTVLRAVVRTLGESKRDYTLLLFSDDLPTSIEPIRVVALTNVLTRYPNRGGSPQPFFRTEQLGNVSADVTGFFVNTWKGGDSGSPDMLPMLNELVFFGGRSTSGPSAEMQSDIDALCVMQGLDKNNYQLQWVDLSGYPTYPPH
jgi:hypothetical protein